MADSASIESLDADSEGELEYRPVERWAFVAVILGLLSPLALAAPVLWLVPILGLLTSGMALRKIKLDPRPGRAVALLGLALSTFFIVLPPARLLSAHFLLARQARPVADKFFEYLQEGSPEKALMLNWAPDFRHPMDDGLWLVLRNDNEAKSELEKFVSHPAIRMILALGKNARARLYQTVRSGAAGSRAQVEYWYGITFTDDDGRKKTYFISLLMERKPTEDPNLNPWRVADFMGGIDPAQNQHPVRTR